jgi:uncharacterized membrane protein
MTAGLTNLGLVHTAVSLVALAAGTIALVRDRAIFTSNRIGQTYIWTTVLTCVTGFPIMQHGGFGPAHVLGIITLLVLAVAWAASRGRLGAASRYVEIIGLSATYFFHWIPTITETSTRLPLGAPLVKDRNGPELQAAAGVLFMVFLAGAVLQWRRLRAESQKRVGEAPRGSVGQIDPHS